MLNRIVFIFLWIASSTTVVAQYDNQKKDRDHSDFGARDGRFESSAAVGFKNGADKDFDGGAHVSAWFV